MYKRVPTQVVVAAFPSEDGAEKCLHNLASSMKKGSFPTCTNAVIASKATSGRVKVSELGKPGMLKGLVGGAAVGEASGAVVGGAALSILGPIVSAAGATAGGAVGGSLGMVKGAIVGTLAKFTVDGMDTSKKTALKEALEPGTSALVLVFAEVIVRKSHFDNELEAFKDDTDLLAQKISTEINKNLKDGNNIAFLFATTEDGFVGQKVVTGDAVLELAQFIITEDAAAVIEFKATPEGAAYTGMVTTEDAVFVEGVVVTENTFEYEAMVATVE
jgi:hypothetical protein